MNIHNKQGQGFHMILHGFKAHIHLTDFIWSSAIGTGISLCQTEGNNGGQNTPQIKQVIQD